MGPWIALDSCRDRLYSTVIVAASLIPVRTTPPLEQEDFMDLQELSNWMKERNLKGHWEHQEWSQTVKPYLWKGDDILHALNLSGELITTGEAGRRTIQMRNPVSEAR
jgi:gentisate 1,2-dioxygenase